MRCESLHVGQPCAGRRASPFATTRAREVTRIVCKRCLTPHNTAGEIHTLAWLAGRVIPPTREAQARTADARRSSLRQPVSGARAAGRGRPSLGVGRVGRRALSSVSPDRNTLGINNTHVHSERQNACASRSQMSVFLDYNRFMHRFSTTRARPAHCGQQSNELHLSALSCCSGPG